MILVNKKDWYWNGHQKVSVTWVGEGVMRQGISRGGKPLSLQRIFFEIGTWWDGLWSPKMGSFLDILHTFPPHPRQPHRHPTTPQPSPCVSLVFWTQDPPIPLTFAVDVI